MNVAESAQGRYVGVDPGSAKCGFAVADARGTASHVEVVPTAEIEARLEREIRTGAVRAVCVGHATTSEAIVRLCRARWPSVPLRVVDETNTSLQARALYYEANPPRGLWRLVPRGLLIPPVTLDGFAALLIVRRYLRDAAETTPERGAGP